LPTAAWSADDAFPIKADDDGAPIANHRVDAAIESEIEKLPGVVIVGTPHGKVTLAEFYDVNCPYCRRASADIDSWLKTNRELRLVLVPFPVLGIGSIQGTRVELAVARLGGAQTFYKFHRLLDQQRGTVSGEQAMAAAQKVGLDPARVLEIANGDDLADVMRSHVKLGDVLAIQATPGFVIQNVVIVGYPGPKAMAEIIAASVKCGAVMCDASSTKDAKPQ
jgi:protein-disulfide isomerase